jgi:hypothetical protein
MPKKTIKGYGPISFRAFALGALNAVVRQDRLDLVQDGFRQIIEEVLGCHACGTGMKLGVGELRR